MAVFSSTYTSLAMAPSKNNEYDSSNLYKDNSKDGNDNFNRLIAAAEGLNLRALPVLCKPLWYVDGVPQLHASAGVANRSYAVIFDSKRSGIYSGQCVYYSGMVQWYC